MKLASIRIFLSNLISILVRTKSKYRDQNFMLISSGKRTSLYYSLSVKEWFDLFCYIAGGLFCVTALVALCFEMLENGFRWGSLLLIPLFLFGGFLWLGESVGLLLNNNYRLLLIDRDKQKLSLKRSLFGEQEFPLHQVQGLSYQLNQEEVEEMVEARISKTRFWVEVSILVCDETLPLISMNPSSLINRRDKTTKGELLGKSRKLVKVLAIELSTTYSSKSPFMH